MAAGPPVDSLPLSLGGPNRGAMAQTPTEHYWDQDYRSDVYYWVLAVFWDQDYRGDVYDWVLAGYRGDACYWDQDYRGDVYYCVLVVFWD